MAEIAKDTDDRLYETCSFIITPLEIFATESNCDTSSGKKKKQNTVLIKLGSITEKKQQLNEPMTFTFTISYSKALRKYYPIKGMIKVYDKSQNGSEMILGVVGFSTDQILNQGLTSAEVVKQVGPVKIRLKINAEKHSKVNAVHIQSKQKNDSGFLKKEGQNRESYEKALRKKISISSVNSFRLSQRSDPSETPSPVKKFATTQRIIGYQQQQTKMIRLKLAQSQGFSNEDIESMILMNQSQQNRNISKKQIQTLGQHLIEQRKANCILQQKLNNANIKIKCLRHNSQSQKQQQFLLQIDKLEQGKVKLMQEICNKEAQIRSLKKSVNEKKNCLTSQQNLQKRLQMQREQIIKMEQKINTMYKQLDEMQENNTYLRQKELNSQSIIFSKDNTIEHLGKLISNQNKQLEQSKKQIKYFNNTICNLQLSNQELKQEISELTQTVQKYRSKYGDLGNLKNKALQQQIKQCIRWIETQGRDSQFNQAEETMQSDFNQSESFSSVIRSLEIESLPLPQISGIRSQLVKILQRVDSLLNRG